MDRTIKISKPAVAIALLLAFAVLIAGCVSQPEQPITEQPVTQEYAQDSSQAEQSVNDFYDEAYATSPNDLPDY